MADSDPSSQQHELAARAEGEERLKYLEFVQTAAFRAAVCFFNVYGYAKDRSGPLKPGVETVEGTVKYVVGPLYDKFHGVPIEVLKFVDRKVDESVTKIDHHVPPTVKQASLQAMSAAQQAPELARNAAFEVQRSGLKGSVSGVVKSVYAKYEPTAKQLYSKYEPRAEQCAASAWHKLNQLPVFATVAHAILPTAAYCTEKYNETVQTSEKKGYKISSYLPLVPTERIVKVFSKGRVEMEPLVN